MVRIPIFWSIPEVEKSSPSKESFFQALMKVLRIPGYLPFCAYCFLLMLFTGTCPMIFSLLEKDVLGFSDDRIVLIGNLMALGGMLGFVLGGQWWTGSEPSMFFYAAISDSVPFCFWF